MESGLEDRNNASVSDAASTPSGVSMESGLEDRNNKPRNSPTTPTSPSQWSPA